MMHEKLLINDMVSHVIVFENIKKMSPSNGFFDSQINKIIDMISDNTKAHDENEIEFTDEFLDSITYEPIIEPVMIPDIDCFFDRTTICVHLLNNNTNPLTRKTMTLKSFNEYNEKPDIIKKINEFKLKKQEFIKKKNN
jgi:hypothetical protein